MVRARRFELVDEAGRVRAVLGPLASAPPAEAVSGLEIRDEHGRVRASLAVSDDGAWLLVEVDGNVAVQAGSYGPTAETLDTGALLVLGDADGAPAAGWAVGDDGRARDIADR